MPFFVARLPDKKALTTFINIAENYERFIYSFHISLLSGYSVNAAYQQGEKATKIKEDQIISDLIKRNSYLISYIKIEFSNHSLEFKRGDTLQPPSIIYDQINPAITNNSRAVQEQETPQIFHEIVRYSHDKTGPIASATDIPVSIPKEYEAVVSIHSQTLSKLEEISAELIQKSHKKLTALEDDYLNKNKSLELKFETQKEKLDEEFRAKERNILDALEVEKNALAEQEKLLKDRASQLDNRNNTHVRREIRDRMLEDVRERVKSFGVSPATERKRKPVQSAMLSLILLFSLLTIATFYELFQFNSTPTPFNQTSANHSGQINISEGKSNSTTITAASESKQNNNQLIAIFIRLSLFSFGLIGSVIYYIKWQNRWADQHIISEFNLQQFYLDINRANWALESCLEWRKETESAIPKELLESLTRGLFSTEAKDLEQVVHPADQLASALLGNASRLKMNLSGNEIEFDKPGKISSRDSIKSKA